jgi:uncharacterized membrane protein YeaQ/YmgE (transglycosylase-associated protein family)
MFLSVQSLIIFLLVGILAGWIAGMIKTGHGFGLLGNMIIGCLGAFVGVFLFGVLGIAPITIPGEIVAAVVGALVLLFLLQLLRQKGIF